MNSVPFKKATFFKNNPKVTGTLGVPHIPGFLFKDYHS